MNPQVKPPVCVNCKVKCKKTEKHRRYECPKCHEMYYLKPTLEECEKLAKIIFRELN